MILLSLNEATMLALDFLNAPLIISLRESKLKKVYFVSKEAEFWLEG